MNYRNIYNISLKDFLSNFRSPLAYIILTTFVIAVGVVFFYVGNIPSTTPFFYRGQADLNAFFGLMPKLLAIFIPALTMKALSEEINTGSFEILSTMPVTSWEIILGKYLSTVYFVILFSLPTIPFAFTVEWVGDLDWGPVVGGFIGTILMGMQISAIGIFASSLTRNQIIAFIVSLAITIPLVWVTNIFYFLPKALLGFFSHLSIQAHFDQITKGVLDTRDLIYFLGMIFVFIYATYLKVDRKA